MFRYIRSKNKHVQRGEGPPYRFVGNSWGITIDTLVRKPEMWGVLGDKDSSV